MFGVLLDSNIDKFRDIVGNISTFILVQSMHKCHSKSLIVIMIVDKSEQSFHTTSSIVEHHVVYLVLVLSREIPIFEERTFIDGQEFDLLKITVGPHIHRHLTY